MDTGFFSPAAPGPLGQSTPAAIKTSDLQAVFTDASATPGNAVINTARGRVAFAAAASAVVVTNSLVTANSMVIVTLRTADGALTQVLRAITAAGSFTITANAASTGTAAQADFLIVN